MIVHASLVGNLVRDELGVVTCRYALVYDLVLFQALLYGRVNELRHFDIVCEEVKRYVAAFGYGDELLLVVVVVRVLPIFNIDVESIGRA